MSASSPQNWTASYNWPHNQCHVAPEARGRGYGAESLRTLEEHACAARAVLEAGIFSRNAVRLDAAAGYEMIDPYSGQLSGAAIMPVG